jgi:uncharacterized integral membrane protein
MRQINFLLVFIFCLALVVFSLQNTDPATINVVKGIQVQAPLCIELILAMGLGSVLAWIFNIWGRFQKFVQSRDELRELQLKEERIQELEADLARYKASAPQSTDSPAALKAAS